MPTKDSSLGRRMTVAAIILSISILLSRVLGFLREAVITYLHGATGVTDAYYAAFTLPDLMNYFLAGGTLSITFIPLFSAFVTRGDEEGGWRLFSIIATTVGAALLVFTVIFELAAPWLVPLLNPGFVGGKTLDLAISMTRIVIPAQLAFYFGGLLQATLFVKETFWPAAVAPLIYNLCIIAGGILLSPWLGIEGFAVGVVVGAFLGPFALPLWAARRDVKFRVIFSVSDPGFKKFILLTLPLMLGVSLVTVDEWLLRYFGSMHEGGAITYLNNARKLTLVVFAVIGQAAGQAALPYLTRLHHEGKAAEMGQMLGSSLQRVAFFAAIGALGLYAVADSLVWVIFRRGQFTAADSGQMSALLGFFALGLVAWSVQALAVRGFYARQDTLTPMIIGTVVVLVMLPVYWALDAQLGLVGLALSTSVGISLNAAATIAVYRLRAGHLSLTPMGKGLLRGVAIGGAGAAGAFGVEWTLATSLPLGDFLPSILRLAALSTGFAMAAALVVLVLRPPEIEPIVAKLRRRT